MQLLPKSLATQAWPQEGNALRGVCERDQTHQAGLLPARHTLPFRLLPAGFAVGSVKIYRLKTLGFHRPCVPSRRAVLAKINSPYSYLAYLLDLNVISWGNF